MFLNLIFIAHKYTDGEKLNEPFVMLIEYTGHLINY